MASAMIHRFDDTDTEDDGRSLAAATTASFSLVPAASSADGGASMAEWTHIGEATVATGATQHSGWEPFPACNDDESLVWADDGTIYMRKSPGGNTKSNSTRRIKGAKWGIDDDEQFQSSDLADVDYNITELKGSVQSNKRERRTSPLILRRFNSDDSDDVDTRNDVKDGMSEDENNNDDETTYTRKSWLPQWPDVEQQSTAHEVSKRKACCSRKGCCTSCTSCHLSFTCHVVMVLIFILVVFLAVLMFFLFQEEILAWL
jgi:hypothetical protein